MNSIIKDNLKELTQLCLTYKVELMYVFGSVCTDKFNEKSDLDFLITFQKLSIDEYTDNYFELHYKLEALFHRSIDLLTDNSLSNPFFIKSVEQTKQLIYVA